MSALTRMGFEYSLLRQFLERYGTVLRPSSKGAWEAKRNQYGSLEGFAAWVANGLENRDD